MIRVLTYGLVVAGAITLARPVIDQVKNMHALSRDMLTLASSPPAAGPEGEAKWCAL